tara:strand:+ start:7573 stop:7710 length:138 start_codon:yes stop_codon:yes gene_type:complete
LKLKRIELILAKYGNSLDLSNSKVREELALEILKDYNKYILSEST